jgi:hypothetical protein
MLGFRRITARGFDVASAQIEIARRLARDLTSMPGVDLSFDVSDLESRMPEADASVDITLCLYSVLSHLRVTSLRGQMHARPQPDSLWIDTRYALWSASHFPHLNRTRFSVNGLSAEQSRRLLLHYLHSTPRDIEHTRRRALGRDLWFHVRFPSAPILAMPG